VEVPTLRHDGTILDTAGWDNRTALLYEPRTEFPPIPSAPTREEVGEAVEHLFDLTHDFPFTGDEHKAAWLAALLTPFARFAFDGPAPLFLFTANCAGTGKSLLCSLISEIVEGRDMARTPCPSGDAEMAKTITSVALAGDKIVLFDNIDTADSFGSASLDAALTGTSWKQRILVVSQMTPDLPLFTTWFATGNNVALRGDIHRRVLPCRLETCEEHPEQRKGFKYPNLLVHVRKKRATLAVAALTILRAQFTTRCPAPALSPFGSFEGWSACVRAAVVRATGLDPVATRMEIVEADETITTLAALLEGWSHLKGGTKGVTAAEALRWVVCFPNENIVLRDALVQVSRDSNLPSTRALGKYLSSHRGRVLHGRAFYGKQDRNGVVRWRVSKPESD
jgi:hypothetical protein